MTVTSAAPSLQRYRTQHVISPVLAAEGWQVCETDSIKVYSILGRRWKHDLEQIRRLISEETRQQIQDAARASIFERGVATFTEPYVSEIADDPLGQSKADQERWR